MNRNFFKNISILAIVSLVLLATVQCIWVVRMYNDQVSDFCRRVESAAYKSIYKAFRMDAVPGIHRAERINIDLEEFALHFVPNLLELDIVEPYYAEILSLPSDTGDEMGSGSEKLILMRKGEKGILSGKVHTTEIIIDDDFMFALRLSIRIPYMEFWSRLQWIVLSSVAIVALLAAILIYLIKTMFRQRTLEQMRRDFTHNITHELKTPIAVASAATDALANFSAEANPERRGRYLEIVGKQLGQLSAMVERILSVSVEGREEKMDMTFFKLFPIINSVIEETFIGLENPPKIDVCCREEIGVYGDKFHLQNVIATMVDNAVKYGGGEIRIEVCEENNGGSVAISIADNGPGISKVHLRHIFERYYRVPQGDLHKVRGYGLGLYYAQKVVQQHSGTIRAESEPGEGSVFTITLPLEQNGK